MAGRTRRILKIFVDIPAWLGAKDIVATTKKLSDRIKSIFIIEQPHHNETFQAALQRLKLTEQDLEQRVEEFRKLLFFYLALGVGFYMYWIYLIWYRYWLSAIIVAAILCVLFSQIFRYHFWIYQIQQQKLGATFWEWIRYCMGKRI